jgi:hypothetical protein
LRRRYVKVILQQRYRRGDLLLDRSFVVHLDIAKPNNPECDSWRYRLVPGNCVAGSSMQYVGYNKCNNNTNAAAYSVKQQPCLLGRYLEAYYGCFAGINILVGRTVYVLLNIS